MTNEPRKVADKNTIFQLMKRIEECIEPDGDKHIKYKAPHSDESIGKEFGVSALVVGNHRTAVFGKFRVHAGGTAFVTRLSRFEARLDAFEERLTKLEEAVTRPDRQASTQNLLKSFDGLRDYNKR